MTEWREFKIKDIADVVGGGTPSTAINEYWNGDIPWLTPKDLTGYIRNFISHGERFITKKGLENSSARLLPKGTVLLTSRAPIGYVAIAENEICTNQGFKSLVPNPDKAHNLFLLYWIKSNVEYLQSIGTGTTFQEISGSVLKDVDIILPPLPEQKAIAEVLSSLDDKIDLLTRQNKTLEDLAQTYFRKWFLEENDNDTIMVSEIAKLENNSVSPKRQPLEPFHHYSIPAYDNAQTPVVELGNTILSNKFTVQPNSILVSKLNPITPRIWRIDENVMPNSVCSTEFQVLKPYDIKHYLFLYFLMKSDDVVSSFAMSATGTSGSHQRIRPEYILEVETPEPDNDKLILFNEICTPMMERVKKNQQQIITLQKLRDTLLPKLISGEVRVKQ